MGVTNEAVLEALRAGELDEILTDIWEALTERRTAGIEWFWKIVFDDLEITEENQTPVEVEKCEKLTGETWATLSPFRSITQRNAIIAVALMERKGMTAAEATDALRKVTARSLVKATTQYAAAAAPFDGGDQPS